MGIDGIRSISSNLATVAINYVAEQMHLPGNPDSITLRCTNKHAMLEYVLYSKKMMFYINFKMSTWSILLIMR